jgi:Tfp pilus assembly PilM family ATPase/Tfp pilus assembly protein PilN
VKRFSFLPSTPVLAEFGQSSLRVLDGSDGLELSLERADNGRLTALCIERLVSSLRVFLGRRPWTSRRKVLCAIGARGISLRRLSLPRAQRVEMERLVLLQIEREFPLLPEELAWGFMPLGPDGGESRPTTQAVLVAAIKSDLLQQYEEVFAGCDVTPIFTLAAWARAGACPQLPLTGTAGMLELGRTASELATFQEGVLASVRSFPFGGESITAALQSQLGLSRPDAEKLKVELQETAGPVTNSAVRDAARAVIAAEMTKWATAVGQAGAPRKILLTGGSARLEGVPETFARVLGPGASCERVPLSRDEGCSAATLGLRAHTQKSQEDPPLVLRRAAPDLISARTGRTNSGAAWKWAALAACLALACVALRFVEPILGHSGVQDRIAKLQKRQAQLPAIDRELAFLQHLRTNQPPYLDLIYTLAESAPPGTRLDAISLNRRGDLAVRATMRSMDEVINFRSKLDRSSQFVSVMVDEQTPSPDQQKMTVRITGQRGALLARERSALTNAPGSTAPAPSPAPSLPMPRLPATPMEMPAAPAAALAGPPPPGPPPSPPGASPGTGAALTNLSRAVPPAQTQPH